MNILRKNYYTGIKFLVSDKSRNKLENLRKLPPYPQRKQQLKVIFVKPKEVERYEILVCTNLKMKGEKVYPLAQLCRA